MPMQSFCLKYVIMPCYILFSLNSFISIDFNIKCVFVSCVIYEYNITQ